MGYWGAGKSLARPGRKQARKHIRDARDFNNIETRAVITFFSLQGKAPKEIHAILTETLACFLPDRAEDLSAPLYISFIRPVLGLTVLDSQRKTKSGWYIRVGKIPNGIRITEKIVRQGQNSPTKGSISVEAS